MNIVVAIIWILFCWFIAFKVGEKWEKLIPNYRIAKSFLIIVVAIILWLIVYNVIVYDFIIHF